MALATLPHAMYYAILAGMLAETFPARMRYTPISPARGAAPAPARAAEEA